MTLEELRKKYGTDGIGLVLRDLASRQRLSQFYAKEVETIIADIESVMKGHEAGIDSESIELDWCCTDEGDIFGEGTAERLGLSHKTIKEYGPGGGWPIIKFSGPRASIEALKKEYGYEE